MTTHIRSVSPMSSALASLVVGVLLMSSSTIAADPQPAPASDVELTPAEQEFVDLLTGATLSGKFSFDLEPDAVPKTERYAIETVRKIQGSQWVIQAKMKVGQAELPVPVPVHVVWADDTPMIQLTDLTIPLVGEGFTARVLFYGNRYAGTWQHGKIGGHMWGFVEKPKTSSGEMPDPALPVEKDGKLP